jgi:predicted nucleotidyltransferase
MATSQKHALSKVSVLGFKEAHDHSDLVCIQDDPQIVVRVATPIGMALLKTIAWKDRAVDIRTKDAKDLLYLLVNYSKIPEVLDAIYADSMLGKRHEWDVDRMSAELLGQRAHDIASPETAAAILGLTDRPDDVDALTWEMADGFDDAIERCEVLLSAFFAGFRRSV